MPYPIFFSWQLDTPPKWGRNFIERALTTAIENLAEDLTVEDAIRDAGFMVDRDTKGISGSPPIVETIFKKIDGACAFVADATFVGMRRDGRPTPNPNVLIEYGWALKSLGYNRTIVIMNTAYGEPDDKTLPFNMKHLRWPIQYHLPEDADDPVKRKVRADLAAILVVALKEIIESNEFKASIPKPPEVPSFVERQPVDGPARFQKRNEPIGMHEGFFGYGGNREIFLADAPSMWLRVMPDKQQAGAWAVSELKKKMNEGGRFLLPLGSFTNWSHIRAPDGFGYIPSMANESPQVPAAILAFKTGEVWSVYSGPLLMHSELGNFEPMFVYCFKQCIEFLRDGLSILPPYRWIAGVEGMKGKKLVKVTQRGSHYIENSTGPCLEDVVMDAGKLESADSIFLGLRPFFRKLYDACGAERPDHMDTILEQQFPDSRSS